MIEAKHNASKALQEIRLLELDLKNHWNDPVGVRFSKEYLVGIEKDIQVFARTIKELDELLQQAEMKVQEMARQMTSQFQW